MLALGSEAPRATRARMCAALVGRVRVCRPPQRGRRKGTWRARARQDAFFKVPLERDQLTRRVALPPLGRLARGLGQSKIRHSAARHVPPSSVILRQHSKSVTYGTWRGTGEPPVRRANARMHTRAATRSVRPRSRSTRHKVPLTQQHNTTCNTLCYTASSVLSLCYARPCYKRCNTMCK